MKIDNFIQIMDLSNFLFKGNEWLSIQMKMFSFFISCVKKKALISLSFSRRGCKKNMVVVFYPRIQVVFISR